MFGQQRVKLLFYTAQSAGYRFSMTNENTMEESSSAQGETYAP